MKEYADFVKEGNFTPLSVLNPDLGMETAIFAEDRGSRMSGVTTAALSGRITGMSGEEGFSSEKESMNLEEAHTKVTEMLNTIEEKTKLTNESFKMLDKPVEKRYKGRRRKISVTDDIVNLSSADQNIGVDTGVLNSATSSRSSGYQSQPDIKDNMTGEVEESFGDDGKSKN